MRNLNQPNERLLDVVLELQHLDRVPRMGYLLRGIAAPESVSEHSFHLALLVLLLAQKEQGLDIGKATAMALLHDCAEVRTGDLPRPAAAYLGEGAKKEMESAVLADVFAPLDDSLTDLLSAYASGDSAEARFVHSCDRLQLLIKAQHYQEHGCGGLDEFWRHAGPTGEWSSIDQIYEELLQRRAGE